MSKTVFSQFLPKILNLAPFSSKFWSLIFFPIWVISWNEADYFATYFDPFPSPPTPPSLGRSKMLTWETKSWFPTKLPLFKLDELHLSRSARDPSTRNLRQQGSISQSGSEPWTTALQANRQAVWTIFCAKNVKMLRFGVSIRNVSKYQFLIFWSRFLRQLFLSLWSSLAWWTNSH